DERAIPSDQRTPSSPPAVDLSARRLGDPGAGGRLQSPDRADGHLRGGGAAPLLQQEQDRGTLADRQVLLLPRPGGGNDQGRPVLRGCLHRGAEVVVSDAPLSGRRGVQGAPRLQGVELCHGQQDQDHQGGTRGFLTDTQTCPSNRDVLRSRSG
ncbi:hypothetical protein CRUP_019043, partial [Coryphaenoides rupestris]